MLKNVFMRWAKRDRYRKHLKEQLLQSFPKMLFLDSRPPDYHQDLWYANML